MRDEVVTNGQRAMRTTRLSSRPGTVSSECRSQKSFPSTHTLGNVPVASPKATGPQNPSSAPPTRQCVSQRGRRDQNPPGTAPADFGGERRKNRYGKARNLPHLSSTQTDASESSTSKLEKLSHDMLQNLNVLRSTEPVTAKSMLPQFAQISDFLCDTIKLEATISRLQKELTKERREKFAATHRAEAAEREVLSLRQEVADVHALARSAHAEAKLRTMEALAERSQVDLLTHQREVTKDLNVSGSDEENSRKDPLRLRCFRLITNNKKTSAALRLVRRQKTWVMARNHVLEEQLRVLYARGVGTGGARFLTEEEIEGETKQLTKIIKVSDKQPEHFKLLCLEDLEGRNMVPHTIELAEDLMTDIIMRKGDPLAFLNCRVKVSSNQTRDACIEIMGRQFYAVNVRNTRLERLMIEIPRIFEQLNAGGIIAHVVKAVREVVSSERAAVWIVDNARGIMWTKVRTSDSMKQMTVQMPLRKLEENESEDNIGLVNASYISKNVVNVRDAHLDHRFDQKADISSGFRTKSVVCFPLFHDDAPNGGSRMGDPNGRSPKIILQAMNKTSPPGYFDANDVYALELLGKVTSEVLAVSEVSKSNATNNRRKDILLAVAVDMMRRSADLTAIMGYFAEALVVLFETASFQLRLAYGDHTKELISKGGKVLLVDPPKGSNRSSGLVGEAIRSRLAVPCSSTSFPTDTRVDTRVDLEIPRSDSTDKVDYMLHSVPVFDNTTISFVLQFWCVVKDRRTMGQGDDGTYSQYNRVHRMILDKLTQFLRARLDEVYPLHDRLRGLKNWGIALRKVFTARRFASLCPSPLSVSHDPPARIGRRLSMKVDEEASASRSLLAAIEAKKEDEKEKEKEKGEEKEVKEDKKTKAEQKRERRESAAQMLGGFKMSFSIARDKTEEGNQAKT